MSNCPFFVLKLKVYTGLGNRPLYQKFSIEDGKYVPFGSTINPSEAMTFMWDNPEQGFDEIKGFIMALNPEELYEVVELSSAIANTALKEVFGAVDTGISN